MTGTPPDIVFVFPPAQGNVGAFRSHLGVAYLRAALAAEGFSTAQYVNPNPGTVNEVAEDLLRRRPGIVGFTVYDANFGLSTALARRLKSQRPRLKVVFGGPSATFCARDILVRHPFVDACVQGEAEETGAAIFAVLANGGFGGELPPGLATRRDGEVVVSRLPALVGAERSTLSTHAALDVVSSPYLAGVLDDGRAGVLTGRGCTHHCQYCCFAALGRKTLRLHSIERVVAELEWIAAHQRRTGERYVVAVHDDAFTLIPSRAKALCRTLAARNLGLALSCITRADAIDEELLHLMREAGFVSMAFGLESAVPSVLRATGKVRPPDWPDPDLDPEREFVERVSTSVVAAKKAGFHVGVSIILGLPAETAEDGEATLRFVKSLPVDFYMHNFLWVFPGTPLWETHDRYGVGCEVNFMGLPTTTEYAYDLTALRPRPKCALEQDALVVRTLTVDSLHACSAPAGAVGIAAAVLEAPGLPAATAEWLAEILDVGGVLIHVYPRLRRAEELLALHRDRYTFSERLIPGRHYVQVLPRRANGGGARWMLACSGVDLFCTHKPRLVTVATSDGPGPLLDWLQGAADGCDLCEASGLFLEAAPLGDVARDAEAAGAGAYFGRMRVPPGLIYPGRWLHGGALCLQLTRIEIDAAGKVRPCRHADPIGTVGDDRPTLAARLAALAAKAERRRGCERCPARRCSRCPFPGMEESEYCRVMRNETAALEVLSWAHVCSRLPSLFTMQRDKVGGD